MKCNCKKPHIIRVPTDKVTKIGGIFSNTRHYKAYIWKCMYCGKKSEEIKEEII